MSLASILAIAWLVNAPAFGITLPPQDPPAPVPVGTSQDATGKRETPSANQPSSDSAAKKRRSNDGANKHGKRHRHRKSVRKQAPAGEPRKIVVREGGATEPPAQIVPGLGPQEAGQQRQGAEELLRAADQNLKLLAARTLESRQQETLAQIRNYLEGARAALKEGDTQRAHTLALKAHLLADDLVKH